MCLTQRSRILLSLVFLAACDGSTAPKNADGDSLSADEIAEIYGQIMGGAQSAPPPSSNIAANAQRMASSVAPPQSYQIVQPCDAGGNATYDVTGTLDLDQVAQRMTFASTQVTTYNNCAFPINPQENFTIVSGTINTTLTAVGTLASYPDTPEMISFNAHGIGNFVLNANNQTLNCGFDLTAVLNEGDTEQQVNGTVCGMQVINGVVQQP